MLEKQSIEVELKEAKNMLEPGSKMQLCLREETDCECRQTESAKDEKIAYYQLGYDGCMTNFKKKLPHLPIDLLDASGIHRTMKHRCNQ